MTQLCHECGENLYNPFFEVSLALIDRTKGRVALSNLTETICQRHHTSLEGDLKANPNEMESELGLAVDGITGCLGGVTGAVQFSTGFDRHLQFKYLDIPVSITRLPKSTGGLIIAHLIAHPNWVEYVDGGWREASWAEAVYARFLNPNNN